MSATRPVALRSAPVSRWRLRALALVPLGMAAWMAWIPSGFVHVRCARGAPCEVTEMNVLRHRRDRVRLEGATVRVTSGGRTGVRVVVERGGDASPVNERPLGANEAVESAARAMRAYASGDVASIDVRYGPGFGFFVNTAAAAALLGVAVGMVVWSLRERDREL